MMERDRKMVDLKGKKLLILAGAGVHSKVVRAAKEMGIYTIVTDYLEDSPAKLIADEAWMLSVTDVDAIVERCRAEGVDGVVNFCIDPAQKPYQQICEKLGVPCYGTKEEFEIFTDKRQFKECCSTHHVDVIPDYAEQEILDGAVEYPVFVKPSISSGSRGQSLCFNKEEALKGIEVAKQNSRDGDFICERHMKDCQDIGTAFFVIDGEPYLVKFGDRHLGREEDNLDRQVICTQLPSPFATVFMEHVHDRVVAMIKALGIKFGPVFMQGFADGNTVYYYDPARRMPGGDYDLVLKEATGFDTVRTVIAFALTGDPKVCFGNPKEAYNLNNGEALLITFSVRPGRMARVEGFDELLKHPDVVYGRQIIPEGSIIPNTGDIQQRVAAVGAYIRDRSRISAFVDYVYKTYRISDENGKDMIVSRYEYKGSYEQSER